MKYTKLNIPDVVLMEPKVFGDKRGFFMETWREDDFKSNIADFSFVQDNHSKSSKGILRGLHYQIKHAQGKLVRVISGIVFDVAVDLRKSSPNFGKWVGVTLSSENKSLLWIPPGFAHGFYVLSDEAEFIYKCTDYYAPEYEQSIKWDDPTLGIDWPLISGEKPLLSPKDEVGTSFKTAEVYK
ncbi:MAG: dTDP-4-dehydrorhamnose 3,5-epimerase [Desulfobacteraceae bacterium]|nr:dTDP-4-dehydrorhamnose 3,5-epimerase [Desulfobacteraceae bacterium]